MSSQHQSQASWTCLASGWVVELQTSSASGIYDLLRTSPVFRARCPVPNSCSHWRPRGLSCTASDEPQAQALQATFGQLLTNLRVRVQCFIIGHDWTEGEFLWHIVVANINLSAGVEALPYPVPGLIRPSFQLDVAFQSQVYWNIQPYLAIHRHLFSKVTDSQWRLITSAPRLTTSNVWHHCEWLVGLVRLYGIVSVNQPARRNNVSLTSYLA